MAETLNKTQQLEIVHNSPSLFAAIVL